jgi:glycosyltransferase involved in cell wall biosynthesis
MRHLDRARFELHAACSSGARGIPSSTFQALAGIPDVQIVPVNFGTSAFGGSRLDKARAALGMLPVAASVAGLARYVRRERIQIVHSGEMPRDALTCALLSAVTGAKAVLHLHVGYGTWMSPLVRWAMRRAHALVGVSEFVVRSLVANGFPAGKVHAVLNAIDAAAWDPSLDPAPVRRELGLPASAPVLVSVSRLFHWKGHADLLRALALVHRDVPEARLVVVGGEYPPGGRYTDEMRALAAQLGVADRVLFTGHRPDVARLLAAADVYAMPSFEEPFGLVYLEAMAMRRPVVALASGGVPEVVVHGETGLLSAPGDLPALAAHLVTVLRDPDLRARMGAAGRRRVETRFTPERMAREAERVLATLAGT